MIALFSRWKLKDGCPPELMQALKKLTADIKEEEPGTLMFSVNFEGDHPPIGPPPEYEVAGEPKPNLPTEQKEIIFFEVYRDAKAFSDHLRYGPLDQFLVENSHLFHTPWQGRVRPITTYVDPKSFFVRQALAQAGEDS